MKILPKNLYSRLALATSVTLVVGYFVVYAWTTLDPVDAGPSKTLTSTLMQGIVNNINDLNTRVSNFGFSAGNIGIGTASPNTRLHISSPGWNQIILEDSSAGVDLKKWVLDSEAGTLRFKLANDMFNASNTVMTFTNNGNVGIGTINPTVPLSVAGAIRVNSNNSANPVCNSTTNGSLWFSQWATGVKDVLSVCAKDATNTFLWRTLY